MSFLNQSIETLPNMNAKRAKVLEEQLELTTVQDLINFIPFRYDDRSSVYKINQVQGLPHSVQIVGVISATTVVSGRRETLRAELRDGSGVLQLIWFKGIYYYKKYLQAGQRYKVYGKVNEYNGQLQMTHPETEIFTDSESSQILPVYKSTEILKRHYITQKVFHKLFKYVIPKAVAEIEDPLPDTILKKLTLLDKQKAIQEIHLPTDRKQLEQARYRLKLEDLLFFQLEIVQKEKNRKAKSEGYILKKVDLLNEFYENHLPFALTAAQKRVIREIYRDLKSGFQMNRLLQGDVGSGKTIVAFISMLIALSNKKQCCLIAPTSILAQQHEYSLQKLGSLLNLNFKLLTGTSRVKERRNINEDLQLGRIDCLIGTHAVLEDWVQFKNLGLCIIDEQHRFGVAQRARLWKKGKDKIPHILVMTATPIPRTLSMSLYGDLDVSIINEMPKGRIPIKTYHCYEQRRRQVYEFIRREIANGRQAYIVYPLIEESEKLDYKNLLEGYENICKIFPHLQVGMLHSKLLPEEKEEVMQAFSGGELDMIVSTTVIEVGVDIPNASVMVIEDADRFGLSQLHQLRGRVGRSHHQSHCFLMSGFKLSEEGKERLQTMVETNDGFRISEVDLKMRGPGDMSGLRQSGIMNFKYANVLEDGLLLNQARELAAQILEEDLTLSKEKYRKLKTHLRKIQEETKKWRQIS